MKSTHITHHDRRRGFTLIELMVVVGIIAVLTAMATYAVASFVANARVSATESLVLRIDRLIASRRQAFDRYIIRADKRAGNGIPEYMTNSSDKQLFNLGRTVLAKTIARKRWYKKAFPQTFAEVNLTAPAGHDPKTESAEMLYYLLNDYVVFGTEPVGTGEFGANEVADTDGDGLMEFIDAWGEPLRFYRWPTRLIRPQPAGQEEMAWPDTSINLTTIIDPQNNSNDAFALFLINTLPNRLFLNTDQDDEFATILAAALDTTPPLDQFTAEKYELNFHTVETWSVPLVISTGEDGELGLYEPNAVASDPTKNNLVRLAQPDWSNQEALEDNISNLYLRTGGR